MKMLKYFFVAIGLLIIILISVRIKNSVVEQTTQTIDIYFDNIGVINDGSNLFSKGAFYYKIRVTDRNGNIMLDGKGDKAEIIVERENYTIVDNNYTWNLIEQIRGISFSTLGNEVINIEIEVMDWFEDGHDKLVGKSIITLKDPLYLFSTNWKTIDLYGSPEYKANITYRIESY